MLILGGDVHSHERLLVIVANAKDIIIIVNCPMQLMYSIGQNINSL